MHENVEDVKKDRLGFRAMMLQEIEGDASGFIYGYDLAV
jgi:hypothetical protein